MVDDVVRIHRRERTADFFNRQRLQAALVLLTTLLLTRGFTLTDWPLGSAGAAKTAPEGTRAGSCICMAGRSGR